MSVTIPVARPSTIKTIETDFATTVSTAIWRKVAGSLNWLDKMYPVGMIRYFHQDQGLGDGNPLPAPNQAWQFCNGLVIPSGPMAGVNVPDLRDRFLRGSNGDSIGVLGGTSSITLTHNHGGVTYTVSDIETSNMRTDDSDEVGGYSSHAHTIASAPYTLQTIPPYLSSQAYMLTRALVTDQLKVPTAPFLDDVMTEYGVLASTEYAAALKTMIDYLKKCCPVGEVVPIMTNLPGVVVDPEFYQLCDGALITSETSPLRGTAGAPRYTPDLQDRFVKAPQTPGLSGLSGGENQTQKFKHNHGGVTGIWTAQADGDMSDALFNVAAEHAHPIATDLAPVYNIRPPYYTVQFYVRLQ